ncbi:regulator of chromosome condensation 1/beta-lactamase-inhibitor protein II [Naematelia encephala]|uniref:Regulator of chromosome condensation 1/beta-lactamase-inhibitor protein II n=1 Tax=Naematelia encephala TaxID=71784 RepID=A0A1Y2AYB2_9TREE|nr:regulator of chromosome condensation 1/beta-lactamase-inhibitor protein II [Naematelia encephala]
MTEKVNLLDVPAEVILDYILPLLPLKDLASFAQVNKQFNALTSDETFWSHKTLSDFTLPSSLLAPRGASSGWSKRVYRGLLFPRTYVWGSADNGRLGTARLDPKLPRGVTRHQRWVDIPLDLTEDFPSAGQRGRTWGHALKDSLAMRDVRGEGRGIVELQASGWGFAARDMDGGVWVWGQLDGSLLRFRAPDWSDKYCQVPEPTLLPLPCRAEAISAGRRHLLVLDTDNLIWELTAWGRAYHHTAPGLTSPSNPGAKARPAHVIQVSAGWDHSACLTSKGEIYVWHPFSQAYTAALTSEAELSGPLGQQGQDDDSRAVRWGTVRNEAVDKLEQVPVRPEWTGANDADTQKLEDDWEVWASTANKRTRDEGEKVVKIASGEGFVVALKKCGEVWMRRVRDGEAFTWEYLPFFSSPSITHISAQFQSLTSYSSTSILHTRIEPFETGPNLRPAQLPALQGKHVIQVAIGDYHWAALTSAGEMYTWGKGNHGELGLGLTSAKGEGSVLEPERVVFPSHGTGDEAFVFGITAGGWHTGALVLGTGEKKEKDTVKVKKEKEKEKDADDDEDDDDGYESLTGSIPGSFPPANHTNHPIANPFFRIGFAGRGARVGHTATRGSFIRRDADGLE